MFFPINQICFLSILTDNNINGATFHRLRRGDLNDLFPETFLLRKELADFLEDLVSKIFAFICV